MLIRTDGHRARRLILVALVSVLVVGSAGCVGDGEGFGTETNATTEAQVTAPPTDEQTPTAEATDAPPETETAGGGEGGADGDSGGEESNTQTLLLLGALAVFTVGFVVAGVLRGRNKSPSPVSASSSTTPTATTTEARSDAERVVSLLHKNNGRMFEDVLGETLDWSPTHARRVVDGLVATGDVERRATDGGTLVVFSDPTRAADEE